MRKTDVTRRLERWIWPNCRQIDVVIVPREHRIAFHHQWPDLSSIVERPDATLVDALGKRCAECDEFPLICVAQNDMAGSRRVLREDRPSSLGRSRREPRFL